MLPQNGSFQVVPIKEITLDLENPRIQKFLEFYKEGEITPEAVAMALGKGGDSTDSDSSSSSSGPTTYQSLLESIRTNKGIINPIVLNKKSDGKYVVIEGNTRVQIYLTLKEKGVPGEWDEIPAIIYDDLDPKGKDAIRLQAHLVGPRPWNPYSKAKYLAELRNVDHLTWNEVAEFCGGNKRQIEDYVAAYEAMEKYYREILPSDSDFDTSRFSAFVELQKPNIAEAIGAHGFTLTDFSNWVHKRNIDPLNTVRYLPRILNNAESKNIFLTGGQGSAREAIKLLNTPIPTGTNLEDATMDELMVALTEKFGVLPGHEVTQIRETPDSGRAQKFNDLFEEVQWLAKEIKTAN
jgi:hypothetical protein